MSVRADILLDALKRVSRVHCGRNLSSLPAPSSVLIENDENGDIKLTATRLDIHITKIISGTFKGSIVVNLKELMKVISSFGSSQEYLSMEVVGEEALKLEVSLGKKKFSLEATIQSEDFPVCEYDLDNSETIFVGPDIVSLMRDALPYVTDDDSRLDINGLWFTSRKGDDDIIHVTATDGHRLFRHCIEQEEDKSQLFEFLLQHKHCKPVIELIDGHKKGTVWHVKADRIIILFSDCKVGETISVKRPEQTPPPWENVIPRRLPNRVIMEMDDFIEAIKTMKVAETHKTNATEFRVNSEISATKLTMKLENFKGVTAEQELECEVKLKNCSELTWRLNNSYLEQLVKSFPWLAGKKVSMQVDDADEKTGMILQGVLVEDGDRLVVIMPVRS